MIWYYVKRKVSRLIEELNLLTTLKSFEKLISAITFSRNALCITKLHRHKSDYSRNKIALHELS